MPSLVCDVGEASGDVCNKNRGPACPWGYTCKTSQHASDSGGICCPKKGMFAGVVVQLSVCVCVCVCACVRASFFVSFCAI